MAACYRPDTESEQMGGDVNGARARFVYVPTQRGSLADQQVTLELRHTVDGRVALLAYTDLDSLVAGCGEAQPWVAVPEERVGELLRLSGAEAVLWDVALWPEQRHGMG